MKTEAASLKWSELDSALISTLQIPDKRFSRLRMHIPFPAVPLKNTHRAAEKLAFLTLSQPSSPLRPPHSGLADTCYGRGWKPRDYLPESFPCEHVQTMPLSCSGDGGGCLFSVARRRGVGGKKAFPRKQVQAQTPQPHGRPQRRPRRVPCPLPARRTGGISPLTLQSGAEYSCLSPIRPPVSPRSWVPPLLLSLSPLNETLPLYIYLSTASLSNPPPLPLLPMWMMESARTETH